MSLSGINLDQLMMLPHFFSKSGSQKLVLVGDEKQLGPVCEARRNLFLGAFLLCFWVGKQMQKEIEVSQKNMLIFFFSPSANFCL